MYVCMYDPLNPKPKTLNPLNPEPYPTYESESQGILSDNSDSLGGDAVWVGVMQGFRVWGIYKGVTRAIWRLKSEACELGCRVCGPCSGFGVWVLGVGSGFMALGSVQLHKVEDDGQSVLLRKYEMLT